MRRKYMDKRLLIVVLCTIVIITTILILFGQSIKFNSKNYIISKEKLVEMFNNNYDKFEHIGKFAQQNKDVYFATSNTGSDISIKFYTGDGKKVENDNSVYNDTAFILKQLRFKRISGDGEHVFFVLQSGGYEQGIIYLKNSVKPDYLRHIEAIKDEKWYYYWTTHE